MRRLLGLVALIGVLLAGWIVWTRLGPVPQTPPPMLDTALEAGARADHILIEKSARRLTAMRAGQPVMTTSIALGFAPTGDKSQEGDGKTPEGLFVIDRKNPNSAYHLSLGINYPRSEDIARATAEQKDPGGDIFIHGQPNSLGSLITLPGDWTAGCIAVTNAEIEALWTLVDRGTTVEIRP